MLRRTHLTEEHGCTVFVILAFVRLATSFETYGTDLSGCGRSQLRVPSQHEGTPGSHVLLLLLTGH